MKPGDTVRRLRDPRRARVRRLLALTITGVLSVAYLWVGTAAHPPGVFLVVPDSTGHALAYAILAVSGEATAAAWGLPVAPLLAVGYAVAHGGLLELAQSWTEVRRAEWRDLGWDAVGAVAAVTLGMAVRRVWCGS